MFSLSHMGRLKYVPTGDSPPLLSCWHGSHYAGFRDTVIIGLLSALSSANNSAPPLPTFSLCFPCFLPFFFVSFVTVGWMSGEGDFHKYFKVLKAQDTHVSRNITLGPLFNKASSVFELTPHHLISDQTMPMPSLMLHTVTHKPKRFPRLHLTIRCRLSESEDMFPHLFVSPVIPRPKLPVCIVAPALVLQPSDASLLP